MNKVIEEIREALKPHHVGGFTAMCFPMPTLQQMERLMAEVERLTALANQRDASLCELSLKTEALETVQRNHDRLVEHFRSKIDSLQSANECNYKGKLSAEAQLLTAREQGRREALQEAVVKLGHFAICNESEQTRNALHRAANAVRALSPKGEICEWRKDPIAGCSTACGRTNSFIMKDAPYCRHCGKPIHIKVG